ncbi:hypothetical protein, partial [Thiolapillus sp.]|uniref:hypothetical protein n=1 Tax=Thiolapillus sp. TaxID=2017437 RepID=UPI003AF52318
KKVSILGRLPYLCPSSPSHQALRNNFASSLLLRTWLPYDWTPRSEAYFVFPLAQGTPGKQCGLAATGVYQPSLRSPWLAAGVLMVILSFAFDTPLAVFQSAWQQIDLFALWMNMLSVLVGQSLWYFPVIGWFLLCTAGTPKSLQVAPAFLIPLLLVVVDKVFSLHTGIPQWLEARTPLASPVGINPQSLLEAIKHDSTVSPSGRLEFDLWPFLGNQQLWWGLFVGVIFALLAARIRRWRDDAI